MCLAVPARVMKIDGTMADVELGGVTTTASVLFTPDVAIGDYVVMHAGYAIAVMDVKEAEETLRLLEQLSESNADE